MCFYFSSLSFAAITAEEKKMHQTTTKIESLECHKGNFMRKKKGDLVLSAECIYVPSPHNFVIQFDEIKAIYRLITNLIIYHTMDNYSHHILNRD